MTGGDTTLLALLKFVKSGSGGVPKQSGFTEKARWDANTPPSSKWALFVPVHVCNCRSWSSS